MDDDPRDPQRRRLYLAEASVRARLDASRGSTSIHNSLITPVQDRRFMGVEQVQRYVDGVLEDEWFTTLYGVRIPIRVVGREDYPRPHYEPPNIIAVSESPFTEANTNLRELVVLHEIAHHITNDRHGPQFAGAYLNLVKHALGTEDEFLLACAFSEHGVKAHRLTAIT